MCGVRRHSRRTGVSDVVLIQLCKHLTYHNLQKTYSYYKLYQFLVHLVLVVYEKNVCKYGLVSEHITQQCQMLLV